MKLTACIGLALALAAARSSAQQSFVLIDLTPGSPYGSLVANGINNLNQVTGNGTVTSTGVTEAYIAHAGRFKRLGLFGYQLTSGTAINDAGQAALIEEGNGYAALLYSHGHVKQIGGGEGGNSAPLGMNQHGDIVGVMSSDNGGLTAFAYVHGSVHDLSSYGLYRASGINDSQQIAGSIPYWYGGYDNRRSAAHGCVLDNGTVTDIGSLTGDPATNTEAFGINNAGDVVGYSTAADGSYHAILYSGGVLQDLGTIGAAGAEAIAINNSGLVVGNLANAYGAGLGAFVYTSGAIYNLTDLLPFGAAGWSGLVITGLNDNGWITGYGTVNGNTHGFVAVPASACVPALVTFDPGPVTGGNATTGAVTLSAPAPTGGLTVALKSHSKLVTAPPSVKVAEGQTSASFPATTSAVTGTKSALITATASGVALPATLIVTKITLHTLTLKPATVQGGNSVIGTVTLSARPSFDAVVTLTSSDPSVATLPATVTIPAGAYKAQLTIATSAVSSMTQCTITAAFGGGSLSTTLTVKP